MGSAVEVIRQTAENENTELIVMGTTGADEMEGFFVGSNSKKVSRKTPCPVLVIPDDHKFYNIDTVCLALDTDNVWNTVNLDVLIALLTAFGVKLRIVHISDGDNETAFKEDELLAHYKKSLGDIEHSFHVFYAENPEDGLEEFLDEYPVGLMALLYRKHGFFKRLFRPGTRKKMVFKTKVPLLILK